MNHQSGSWIEDEFGDHSKGSPYDIDYYSQTEPQVQSSSRYNWQMEGEHRSFELGGRGVPAPPHSISPEIYSRGGTYDVNGRSDHFSTSPRGHFLSQQHLPLGSSHHQHYSQAPALPEVQYSAGPAERSYHSEVASSASHFTRHARRVYVGGIPPGHTQEDQVKTFLNEVISNCMDEDHSNNYILSVYMNHKKCFAFVELCSVELTQACLELDGIVYRSSVLKIQRANEYKPELLPSPPKAPVRFQASKAPFPNNVANMIEPSVVYPGDKIPMVRSTSGSGSSLQRVSLRDVTRGSVTVIGFPYDEGDRRSGIAPGAASACRVIRHFLRRVLNSPINPEFGLSVSGIRILDIGDVPLGLTLEDALSRLDDTVSEIVRRGGLPLVIGGSGDLSYACTAGLMSVLGSAIGVVKVDSRLNMSILQKENKIESASSTRLLLSDTRFCTAKEDGSEPSCDGKLVLFGLQGTCCAFDQVELVKAKGASVLWLNKDIRNTDPFSTVRKLNMAISNPTSPACATGEQNSFPTLTVDTQAARANSAIPISENCVATAFGNMLNSLIGSNSHRPVHVSFSAHAISDMACPGKSCHGSDGFQPKEIMDICIAAGACANVSLVDLSGFNPDVEEIKSGVLVAEMIYFFLMGYSLRPSLATPSDSLLPSTDTASFLVPSTGLPSMVSYFPRAIGSRGDRPSPPLQSPASSISFQDDPFFFDSYPVG